MQDAFADSSQAIEAEALIKRDGVGLGVGDHADATDAVALIASQGQDVAQEGSADAVPLRSQVDAEAG